MPASSRPRPDPSPLLTFAAVAERLDVSTRTVRRLVDAKELAVIRIGRSVRVDPRDLERFLAAARG
jgi:excisionase family DNA binding protein